MLNKVFGKAIELFFVNGTSDGIITAELRNWSGKAIKVPRIEVNKYPDEELSYTGIYLLYCTDDDGNEKIYVGESENVKERLKNHIADYDKGKEPFYWSFAVAFVDNGLDKAEIRYIENKFANEIAINDQRKLLTKSTYNRTNLKASQIAVAEEFAENAKTLLEALGIKLNSEAPKAESDDQYLYCKSRESNANAIGFVSNNGFTVLKDSTISQQTTPSFSNKAYYRLREKLMAEGVIVNYTFTKNYEFKAPSAASSVVLGRASNGQTAWKNKNGQNLQTV